jgi:serine/threonine protein kinase
MGITQESKPKKYLLPENLLLDSYGNLKVSDFGLSALSQQLKVKVYCFLHLKLLLSLEKPATTIKEFQGNDRIRI